MSDSRDLSMVMAEEDVASSRVRLTRKLTFVATMSVVGAIPLVFAYVTWALLTQLDCGGKVCTATAIELFGRAFPLQMEGRLMVLAAVLGGFGASITGFRSLESLRGGAGNVLVLVRTLTNPLLGATVAEILFLVIRGAVLAPGTESAVLSPIGIALMGMAAGFFTPRMIPELLETANATFGSRVDTGLVRRESEEEPVDAAGLARQLNERLDALLALPVLDNWSGTVVAQPRPPDDRRGLVLAPGEPLAVNVGFIPARFSPGPASDHAQTDRIEIAQGNPDPENVRFDIALDGTGFDFRAGDSHVAATVSDKEIYWFELGAVASPEDEPRQLFVEISQKGRLVQTLFLDMTGAGGDNPQPRRRRGKQ